MGWLSGVRRVVWRKGLASEGLYARVAWVCSRPWHGMGKVGLWEIGRGGMALGVKPCG